MTGTPRTSPNHVPSSPNASVGDLSSTYGIMDSPPVTAGNDGSGKFWGTPVRRPAAAHQSGGQPGLRLTGGAASGSPFKKEAHQSPPSRLAAPPVRTCEKISVVAPAAFLVNRPPGQPKSLFSKSQANGSKLDGSQGPMIPNSPNRKQMAPNRTAARARGFQILQIASKWLQIGRQPRAR